MTRKRLLVTLAGLAVLWGSGYALAEGPPPEVIRFEGTTGRPFDAPGVYPRVYSGRVEFQHGKHFTDSDVACGDCHHADSFDPGAGLETDVEITRCIECHDEPGLVYGRKADELDDDDLLGALGAVRRCGHVPILPRAAVPCAGRSGARATRRTRASTLGRRAPPATRVPGMDARLDVARVRGLFPALADGFVHTEGIGGALVPENVARAVGQAMRMPIADRGGVFPASGRAIKGSFVKVLSLPTSLAIWRGVS